MMIFAAALTGGLFVFMLVYFFVMTRLIPKTQVQQRLRDIRYGSAKKEREIFLIKYNFLNLFYRILSFLSM